MEAKPNSDILCEELVKVGLFVTNKLSDVEVEIQRYIQLQFDGGLEDIICGIRKNLDELVDLWVITLYLEEEVRSCLFGDDV